MLGNQYPSTSSLQSDLKFDEDDNAVLTTKIGTKWKKVQVGELSTDILVSYNILKESPGPSSYALRNIQALSPASAWLLFIDKFILEHIRKCTITEAHRQTVNKEVCLANNELLTFIHFMYTRGVIGSNNMPYDTLWTENWACLCVKKKQYQGTVSGKFYVFSALTQSRIDLRGRKQIDLVIFGGVEQVHQ